MKAFWESIKVPFLTIFFIFFFLFLYTRLAGPVPFFVTSVQTTKTSTFQATGDGEVAAAPDIAIVDAGVTKQGNTVTDAQNQTNSTMQQILNGLKKLGIEDKDIKTTNYSVVPNYNFSTGSQSITGYTVTQNLEIKIKPIDKLNSVIDSLTGNGANLVGQVRFDFADDTRKALEDKARQQAVETAKEKAQSLAQAAGIHLGQIINVEESPNVTPVVMKPLGLGAGEAAPSQPTQVTPGENSISISVTLSYTTY